MQQPKFRVSGAFFENERDSGPAFSGFVEIDGVRTSITLWPKTSKAGKNYLQVSEDKKARPPSNNPPISSPFKPKSQPSRSIQPKDDMDDDIPF